MKHTVGAYERIFEESLAIYSGPKAKGRFAGSLTSDDIANNRELLPVLRSNLNPDQWADIPDKTGFPVVTRDDALNKLVFLAIQDMFHDYLTQAEDDKILRVIPTYDHEAHVHLTLETIHNPVRYTQGLVTAADVDALKARLIEGIEHPKQGMWIFETEVKTNLRGNYANICRAIIKKTEYLPGWEFPDNFRRKLGLRPVPRIHAMALLKDLQGLNLSESEQGPRDALCRIFKEVLDTKDPVKARRCLEINEHEINSNLTLIKRSLNKPHNSFGNQFLRIIRNLFHCVYALYQKKNPMEKKQDDGYNFALFHPKKAESLAREIQETSDKLAPKI